MSPSRAPARGHHQAGYLFPSPSTIHNPSYPSSWLPPCYRQVGMANATASRRPLKNAIPSGSPKKCPNPTENKIVTLESGSALRTHPGRSGTPGPAQSCGSPSCLKNLRSPSTTPPTRPAPVGMANATAPSRHGGNAGNGIPAAPVKKRPNPTENKIVMSENVSALPKPGTPKVCTIIHKSQLSQKSAQSPIA